MGRITIIAEKVVSGFTALVKEVPQLVASGENLEETEDKLVELLEDYCEGISSKGDELPEMLKGKVDADIVIRPLDKPVFTRSQVLDNRTSEEILEAAKSFIAEHRRDTATRDALSEIEHYIMWSTFCNSFLGKNVKWFYSRVNEETAFTKEEWELLKTKLLEFGKRVIETAGKM